MLFGRVTAQHEIARGAGDDLSVQAEPQFGAGPTVGRQPFTTGELVFQTEQTIATAWFIIHSTANTGRANFPSLSLAVVGDIGIIGLSDDLAGDWLLRI